MAKSGIRVLYMVASPHTKLCRIMCNINKLSWSPLPTRYSETTKSPDMGGLLRGHFTTGHRWDNDVLCPLDVPILLHPYDWIQ